MDELINALDEYFCMSDTYAFNLTRVKESRSCGTMTIDDFEEFDEETISDLAEFLINKGLVK